jgi:hypothetical protein
MGRWLTVIAVGAASLIAAPAAYARVDTGNQNPNIVVVAQIGPNHIDVGERVVWSGTIVNVSDRSRCIEFEMDYESPTVSEFVGGGGCLAPGEDMTFGRSRRATAGGDYTVKVRAWTRSGAASYAKVHAVA